MDKVSKVLLIVSIDIIKFGMSTSTVTQEIATSIRVVLFLDCSFECNVLPVELNVLFLHSTFAINLMIIAILIPDCKGIMLKVYDIELDKNLLTSDVYYF